MSRSALLFVACALLAVLGVVQGSQAIAGQQNLFWYNSNPNCLGEPETVWSWPLVTLISTPNCTNFTQSGIDMLGGNPPFFASSLSPSCPTSIGQTYTLDLHSSPKCSDLRQYQDSISFGCSLQNPPTKREAKAASGVTWRGSRAFTCNPVGEPPVNPYVGITYVDAPCPVMPGKRAASGYTAIFANSNANTCVQYYNQTQEVDTWVKLPEICAPAAGSVTYTLYSDDACTNEILTLTDLPLSTCIPSPAGRGSLTITCVPPAGYVTPTAPTAPTAPPTAPSAPSGSPLPTPASSTPSTPSAPTAPPTNSAAQLTASLLLASIALLALLF